MGEPKIALLWGADSEADPQDPGLARRLASLRADYGPLVVLQTYRGDPMVAVGREVVVHLASSKDAGEQLRREDASRRWAQGADVRVPMWEIVSSNESTACSLVSERVAFDPGIDAGYAVAAASASRQMQTASVPPPAGGRTWRASRRNKPIRAYRALLSPLRVGEARAVRNAALALPSDGWAHGDYRTYNVLYDSDAQQVHLVDWEYVGRAWRGSDLLSLWAGTDKPEVADVLLESVLADRSPAETADVGLMLMWSCVRVLAEQVTGGPMYARDRERIARVNARVARARNLARDLGTVLP